jgi:uncharacterized membrane protein
MAVEDRSVGTSWLLLGIGLYMAVAVLGLTVYGPVLRKQAALAEQLATEDGGADAVTSEYRQIAHRSTMLGVLATIMVVVIVVLMVTQPQLW